MLLPVLLCFSEYPKTPASTSQRILLLIICRIEIDNSFRSIEGIMNNSWNWDLAFDWTITKKRLLFKLLNIRWWALVFKLIFGIQSVIYLYGLSRPKTEPVLRSIPPSHHQWSLVLYSFTWEMMLVFAIIFSKMGFGLGVCVCSDIDWERDIFPLFCVCGGVS